MILAQTKIFNIFPGSIQTSSIVKILSSFCSRYKYNYVPNRDLWINRLNFDISNSTKKQCLTIDTRGINDLGPAKFRTQAEINQEQISYYNHNKRDTSFNCFLAVRKQTPTISDITFPIIKLIIDKSNKNSIYFEINHELGVFNNDSSERPIQQISESNISREKSTDRKRQGHEQRTNGVYRQISKKPQFLSGW